MTNQVQQAAKSDSQPQGDLSPKPAYIPQALWPYVQLGRFERLIGSYLLFWPCVWGLALALLEQAQNSSALESTIAWSAYAFAVILAVLFLICAILMRGAGCAINDFFDRKIDAKVERTKQRPLARKAITPRHALYFTALLCLVSLGLMLGALALGLMRWQALAIAMLILPLVVLYPLAKRVTRWPQAVLGLTFNWGVWVGYFALQSPEAGLSFWPLALLYFSGVLWTIGYDTIYAHQDRQDDAMLGLGSTALLFGAQSRWIVALFYSCQLALLALVLLFTAQNLSLAIKLALLLPIAVQLAWQIWRLDINSPQRCLQIFRSNNVAGALIAAALIMAALLSGV